MKKQLICFLCALLPSLVWSNDGDVFTGTTVEGVEMSFRVVSEDEKTCEVNTNAIDVNTIGSVSIPAVVNDYKVIGIRRSAFLSCSAVTSFIVPDGITSIGGWAFRGCTAMTSIIIPESLVSIEFNAF